MSLIHYNMTSYMLIPYVTIRFVYLYMVDMEKRSTGSVRAQQREIVDHISINKCDYICRSADPMRVLH